LIWAPQRSADGEAGFRDSEIAERAPQRSADGKAGFRDSEIAECG